MATDIYTVQSPERLNRRRPPHTGTNLPITFAYLLSLSPIAQNTLQIGSDRIPFLQFQKSSPSQDPHFFNQQTSLLYFFPFAPPDSTAFELFMIVALMSSMGSSLITRFSASDTFDFSHISTMLFAIAPFFAFPDVSFTRNG